MTHELKKTIPDRITLQFFIVYHDNQTRTVAMTGPYLTDQSIMGFL
jgi:hypothetical protein